MVQRARAGARVNRLQDVERLYAILGELGARVGPFPRLRDCNGRMNWPTRGVYFFFEDGEGRSTSGTGPRIVRVGTHALKTGSATTLWKRLSQHRGPARSSVGNHRGSVFRLLVGEALIRRQGLSVATWGAGRAASDAGRDYGMASHDVLTQEQPIERAVSEAIGAMTVAWVRAGDEAGPASVRGKIERNVIALLSNWDGGPMDPSSAAWLGRSSEHERVTRSALWNNNHVDEPYKPAFLEELERAGDARDGRRPMTFESHARLYSRAGPFVR